MSLFIRNLQSSFNVEPEARAASEAAPLADDEQSARTAARELNELERRLERDRWRTYARGYAD
jgi:hypothetical protein